MSWDADFSGAWADLERILGTPKERLEEVHKATARAMADEFLVRVKEGIEDQSPGGREFAPLLPSTLARRARAKPPIEGSKALLARREMVNALKITSYGNPLYVGIGDEAKGSDGTSLARRARVHEFGFSMARGSTITNVPARPFIGPVLDAMEQHPEKIQEQAKEELAKAMGLK